MAESAPDKRAAGATAETEPGQPMVGLTAAQSARFQRGRDGFEAHYSLQRGLGPIFSDTSCNRCHNLKGVGGAGFKSARLIGRTSPAGFDPLLSRGGPMLAQASVSLQAGWASLLPDCRLPPNGEPLPAEATVVAFRRTPPLFGLGLVDATPEAVFEELARRQAPAVRGRVARLAELEGGHRSVGKFGWKAQSPSLRHFAGLALLAEMGITSPGFPEEEAPLGDPSLVAGCDLVAGLEQTDAGVLALTDFMQMLAPIAPLPQSPAAREGDALFSSLGCDGCHVRRLRSGASPIAALSEQDYAPFSDFLLHDMGLLGDGIAEGAARPREMRTAPLWGGHLLGSGRLLHDGRAHSFEEAILLHNGQGAAARGGFAALSEEARGKLVAFLATL